MKISHIMSILMTLTDSSAIRQSVRLKNIFVNIVYNFLVVKEFWENIKKKNAVYKFIKTILK